MSNEITPEQWDIITECRQRWLRDLTKPTQIDDVEDAVARIWKRMSQSAPCVVKTLSPIGALFAGAYIRHDDTKKVLRMIYDRAVKGDFIPIPSRIDENIATEEMQRIGYVVKDVSQLFVDTMCKDIGTDPSSVTREAVASAYNSNVIEWVRAQKVHDLKRNMSAVPRYISIWWRAWAGWYEGGYKIGVQYDKSEYEDYQAWAANIPFIVPMVELAIVSESISHAYFEGRELNNESGPAMRFADGWSMWAISGVRVDEQIVMDPGSQTIQQIHDEGNTEVQRIRIDRFGWSRYLEESGAKVLDEGRNDIENTYEVLADTPLGQRLITHCPSTGRRYSLGLPGDRVKTCEEAQQRLWGDRQNFTIVGRV